MTKTSLNGLNVLCIEIIHLCYSNGSYVPSIGIRPMAGTHSTSQSAHYAFYCKTTVKGKGRGRADSSNASTCSVIADWIQDRQNCCQEEVYESTCTKTVWAELTCGNKGCTQITRSNAWMVRSFMASVMASKPLPLPWVRRFSVAITLGDFRCPHK